MFSNKYRCIKDFQTVTPEEYLMCVISKGTVWKHIGRLSDGRACLVLSGAASLDTPSFIAVNHDELDSLFRQVVERY